MELRLYSTNSYSLVDSTVVGSWNDSYLYYNCYGYSIKKYNNLDNPGDYSGQSFSISMSVDQIAHLVQDDLDFLGYWSSKSTTRPTSLASWEQAICVRKGTYDYHFMRYTVAKWYHKPGNTNPLKWNYASPGYKIWTNECSFMNIAYAPTITYNSQIYYIKYWAKDGPGPQHQSVVE